MNLPEAAPARRFPRQLVWVLVVLLVAGFIASRSANEGPGGNRDPETQSGNSPLDRNEPRGDTATRGFDANGQDQQEDAESGTFTLRQLGQYDLQSPAGLVYGRGPGGEHRIDHILRHGRDDLSREVHGVFRTSDRNEVLQLLDRAWEMARSQDPAVRQQEDEDRTEWTIDFPEVIGYVGGKDGRERGNPETSRLVLVTEGNRVITAYPDWPPRNRGRR